MYHGALGFLTVGISIGNGDWNRGHFAIFRKFAGVKELKHVADINHVCNERKPCRNSSIAFRTFPVRSISSSEMASEQRSRREWFGGSCALRPLVVFCEWCLVTRSCKFNHLASFTKLDHSNFKCGGSTGISARNRRSIHSFIAESKMFCALNVCMFQARLVSLCADNSVHLWEINTKDGDAVLENVRSIKIDVRYVHAPVYNLVMVSRHDCWCHEILSAANASLYLSLYYFSCCSISIYNLYMNALNGNECKIMNV